MIQVVKRTVDLLRAVRALESAPLRDIATACELPKTTAGNILRSLSELGMLDQAPNGDYRIGAGLRELTAADPERTMLAEAAGTVIPKLAAKLGETVLAVRLRGPRLDVLAEAAGTRSIVVHPDALRDISPMTWATGRVLLAWLPMADPRRKWQQPDTTFARELERIRHDHVAFRQSPDGEIQSVAVPVLRHGQAIASVGLCMPVFRYENTDRAELIAELRHAADQIASSTQGDS
jgi:DNA-binding IclR family transcriptional regulator